MTKAEVQDRPTFQIVGGVYLLSGLCGLIALALFIGRIVLGPIVPFRLAFLIIPAAVMLSAKIVLANMFRWSRR